MLKAKNLFLIPVIILTFLFSVENVFSATKLQRIPVNNNGLVGYWSMDSTDINWNTNIMTDRSGNSNSATLTSMSTTTSPGTGKIGQSLYFDGSNDILKVGQSSSINNLTTMTVCTWIYRSSATGPAAYSNIMAKSNNGLDGWTLYYGNGNSFGFSTRLYGYKEISAVLSINVWQYVCATWDGSEGITGIKLYVNGVDIGGNGSDTGGSTYNDSAVNLTIGSDEGPPFSYITRANLDDIRIYNRVLSLSEIKNLYNHGSAKSYTSQRNFLNTGLVGYWSFNGADINWGTNTITDRSGSGNNGTLENMSTTTSPVTGKIGQALQFDGVNDRIIILDNNSLDLATDGTVCVWANWKDFITDDVIIRKRRNYQFIVTPGSEIAFQYTDPSANLEELNGGVFSLNRWYHYCGVISGSNATALYIDGVLVDSTASVSGSTIDYNFDLTIASDSPTGAFFAGALIDDVRIYSRALSASEIKQMYNGGVGTKTNSSQTGKGGTLTTGLVGYWSFNGADINWGTNTATDRSTNAISGTITNMSTTTSPTTGKMGQALYFDGSNDWVNLSTANAIDDLGPISVSAWIKSKVFNDGYIIAKRDAGCTGWWSFSITATGQIEFRKSGTVLLDFISSASTVTLNQWEHVVAVWDGTNSATAVRMYANGQEVSYSTQTAGSGAASDSACNASLGARSTGSSNFFNGDIDEVRLYNRIITPTEIKQLYNSGR